MLEAIAEPLLGSGFLVLADVAALSTTCHALLPLRGHLERIVLRNYDATTALAAAEAPAFTRLLLAQKALRVLELRYRPLGWVLPFLARPSSTRALQSLNLSWNILQPLPMCLASVFTPGAFPSLRDLTLGGPWSSSSVEESGWRASIPTAPPTTSWLSPSVFPGLVSLSLLDITGPDTPRVIQSAFAQADKWPRLERLVLQGCLGGDAFMATLAVAIGSRRMPRLRFLELMDPSAEMQATTTQAAATTSSATSPFAMVALVSALRQVPALEHLSLGGCAGMSGEAAEALGQVIGERGLPCLTALQLLSCDLTATDVGALVRGLTGGPSSPRGHHACPAPPSKLLAIDLRRNARIGDAGVIALAQAFAESRCCPSLVVLELQDCGVGTMGVVALARAIKSGALPGLKSLALSGPVTHVGISALADALRAGGAPRLEGLYLWDTPGLSQGQASFELARALTGGACPCMKELGGNPSEAALRLLRTRGPEIQAMRSSGLNGKSMAAARGPATGAGDVLTEEDDHGEEEEGEKEGEDVDVQEPVERPMRLVPQHERRGSHSEVRYRRKSLEGDYGCSICYELLARPVVLSTSGLTACESCIALLLVHHWQAGKEGAPDPLLGADHPSGLITKLPPVCAQLHSFLEKRFPDEYVSRLQEVEAHAEVVSRTRNHSSRTSKLVLEKAALQFFTNMTEDFIGVVQDTEAPSPYDFLLTGLWNYGRLGLRSAVTGALAFAKKTRGVLEERERAVLRGGRKDRVLAVLGVLVGLVAPLVLMVIMLMQIGQWRVDHREDVVKAAHLNAFVAPFVLTGDFSAMWRLQLSHELRNTPYQLFLKPWAQEQLLRYRPLVYRILLAPPSRLRLYADADAVHIVMACLYLAREAVAFISYLVHFTYYRLLIARRRENATTLSVLAESLRFLLVVMVVLEVYNLFRFLEGLAVGVASLVVVFQTPILRELYWYANRAGFEVMVLMNLQLLDPIAIDPRKDKRILRALTEPSQGAPFGGLWQEALGQQLLPFLEPVDVLTALAMVHRFSSRPLHLFYYN